MGRNCTVSGMAIHQAFTKRSTAVGAYYQFIMGMDRNRVMVSGMATILNATTQMHIANWTYYGFTTVMNRNRIMGRGMATILIAWKLAFIAIGAIISFTFMSRDRVTVSVVIRILLAFTLLMMTMVTY
ncbi:hypothetical protein ACFL40_03980 [candidate division KSB1 bacterium]